MVCLQVESDEASTDMCFLPEKPIPDGYIETKEVPSMTMCIDDSVLSKYSL